VDAARANFIKKTRELRSDRSGRTISDEEARDIIDNMVGFAEVLIDWYLY